MRHWFTLVIAILFLLFSTFGTNLRGVWDASQPFFNQHAACAYNSFPLNPCRRDIIAALGRWGAGQLALGHQVVARAREAGERLQHGTWTVGEPLPFGLYTVGDSTFTGEARQPDAVPLPANTRRQSPVPIEGNVRAR